MTRILIVDDEPQILRALRINLTARQYEVLTAAGGTEALRVTSAARPDLLVLDLGLPDLDGVEVIRQLRAWNPVPIIVVSGRAGGADKIEALEAGADDYVTKPFNVDELVARIRAVRRRIGPSETPENARIGRFTVDLVSYTVADEANGEAVHLTKTEWQILEILLQHPGVLVTQRKLLQQVWGPAYRNETHYLRQYMAQLRRKLEPDHTRPRYLITEPGMGYRFQP
ncbi:response regulator [Longispora albida]|uniref:response regulator n=1 Tax=Longispora albida TaxID=203523 RepID=UPI00037888FB|nr:response regulator [Longispora albida]